MSDSQPHRVVFKKYGRNIGIVFPNADQAREFANTIEPDRLITVQPATEPIPDSGIRCPQRLTERRTETVKCECGSGRTRLVAEKHCALCSGYLDVDERIIRIRKTRTSTKGR